ncbi:hypothetical protein VIGAN_01415600, partial [Vigna angularis var. angularis]
MASAWYSNCISCDFVCVSVPYLFSLPLVFYFIVTPHQVVIVNFELFLFFLEGNLFFLCLLFNFKNKIKSISILL